MGIGIAQNYIEGLISICLKAINTPSNSTEKKKSACDLLTTLGTHLKPVAEHAVPTYQVRNTLMIF